MVDLNNPADAFSRSKQLLSMLGTFWNMLYTDSGTVAAYVRAKNQADLQTYRDLMELVACTSRFTVPIFHKSNWSILTIRKSAQLSGHLLEFGDGAVFGNNPQNMGNFYYYGVSVERTTDFNPPPKLESVNVIVNRISDPSVTWTNGVDFIVDNTPAIRFREDPFNNPLIPTRPVYNSTGQQIDIELSLWMFMAEYDWQMIYEQFGYVLGLHLESSENYRNLVNTIWDAISQGSTYIHLKSVLASMAGVMLSVEPIETVVDIVAEPDRLLILTDRRVYSFSNRAIPAVSVNQTLTSGSTLVDAFKIYNPYTDTLPASDIPSLVVTPGMLVGPFAGNLTFVNQPQPTTVTYDANNRTVIQFPITGSDSDVALFWNTVRTNGTAPGAVSLAQLLDLRAPPIQANDPTAANLPTSINPADFLAKNVLRNNALVVVFKESAFGPDALGLSNKDPLRQVLPAHSAMFIMTKTG
jgi:hypothetical protein